MKPIRIAIIGYGKIAEDQHVPSIQKNDRFELAATSSRSGQGVGQKFTDWRELIRKVEGLEAVAITTPPEPRYTIARECIEAGLQCLLEKPPTKTIKRRMGIVGADADVVATRGAGAADSGRGTCGAGEVEGGDSVIGAMGCSGQRGRGPVNAR